MALEMSTGSTLVGCTRVDPDGVRCELLRQRPHDAYDAVLGRGVMDRVRDPLEAGD